MFVKNDPSPEKRYYNGKIGKIVSFDRKNGVQVECDNEIIDVRPVTWHNFEYKLNGRTKEIEEKGIGSFTQIPLKTAWAIWGLLCLHMNCEIFCSSSVKNAFGNLTGIALNLRLHLVVYSFSQY